MLSLILAVQTIFFMLFEFQSIIWYFSILMSFNRPLSGLYICKQTSENIYIQQVDFFLFLMTAYIRMGDSTLLYVFTCCKKKKKKNYCVVFCFQCLFCKLNLSLVIILCCRHTGHSKFHVYTPNIYIMYI